MEVGRGDSCRIVEGTFVCQSYHAKPLRILQKTERKQFKAVSNTVGLRCVPSGGQNARTNVKMARAAAR